MRNIWAIGAVALLLASAARADSPTCVKRDGEFPGPFVPNATVAKAIYIAIDHELTPLNAKRYPIVTIADEGDHWSLSRTVPKPEHPITFKHGVEYVAISAGGGMLDLNIDKCSGAITYAALDK